MTGKVGAETVLWTRTEPQVTGGQRAGGRRPGPAAAGGPWRVGAEGEGKQRPVCWRLPQLFPGRARQGWERPGGDSRESRERRLGLTPRAWVCMEVTAQAGALNEGSSAEEGAGAQMGPAG